MHEHHSIAIIQSISIKLSQRQKSNGKVAPLVLKTREQLTCWVLAWWYFSFIADMPLPRASYSQKLSWCCSQLSWRTSVLTSSERLQGTYRARLRNPVIWGVHRLQVSNMLIAHVCSQLFRMLVHLWIALQGNLWLTKGKHLNVKKRNRSMWLLLSSCFQEEGKPHNFL